MGLLQRFRSWLDARADVRELLAANRALEKELDAKSLTREQAIAEIAAAVAVSEFQDWTGGQDEEKFRSRYDEMRADPSVKAAFNQVFLGVAALDLQVTPGDDKDERSREAAEFVDWSLRNVRGGFAGGILAKVLVPGLQWGYSISEKVYAAVTEGRWAGKWTLDVLKSKDVSGTEWGFKLDAYRNVEALLHVEPNGVVPLPPDKFVHWAPLAEFELPRATSWLRAAYRPWWVKQVVLRAWAYHAEMHGIFPVGTYANKKDKEALETQLKALRARRYVALPEDVKIEVRELVSAGVTEGNSRILDYLDKQIFLAITHAYLQALEGTLTGARNMGIVHQGTTDLLLWYLSQDASGTVKTQVTDQLSALNFGRGVAPPLIDLEEPDLDYLNLQSQIDERVGRFLPLSKSQLYKTYGRRPPLDEEDAVLPPAPAPVPFGAPPAPPQGDGGEEFIARFAADYRKAKATRQRSTNA